MATITGSLIADPIGAVARHRWTNLANGDTGAGIDMREYYDRSIQVAGTFGTGGTVVIEGTIDGTNWHTLSNGAGDSLTFTSGGVQFIAELVFEIRPRVTAGDGTTSITVTGFFRRTS